MGQGIGLILGTALLAFASLVSTPFLRNTFEMRAKRNWREAAGSLFWAAIPFAMIFFLWAWYGDGPLALRNMILGMIGAVVGASGFIWCGYVIADTSIAKAQTSAPTPSQPPAIGDNNTVVGITPPSHMGSGNTFVGPTDARGNTLLNRGGTAIGTEACASSTGVAIGSRANAGCRPNAGMGSGSAYVPGVPPIPIPEKPGLIIMDHAGNANITRSELANKAGGSVLEMRKSGNANIQDSKLSSESPPDDNKPKP
jgi:hypothetical protein